MHSSLFFITDILLYLFLDCKSVARILTPTFVTQEEIFGNFATLTTLKNDPLVLLYMFVQLLFLQ